MNKIENNKKGFTLLELLVVVLIIGILAAIALPQYNRVVEKSKSAQALTILKAVSESIQRYYLVNGTYPTDFNQLDIEIPFQDNKKFINNCVALSNGDWSLSFENQAGYIGLMMGRIKGKYAGAYFYAYFQDPSGNIPPTIFCAERKTSGKYIFDENLSEGSYCEKIINGSFKANGVYARSYYLP